MYGFTFCSEGSGGLAQSGILASDARKFLRSITNPFQCGFNTCNEDPVPRRNAKIPAKNSNRPISCNLAFVQSAYIKTPMMATSKEK